MFAINSFVGVAVGLRRTGPQGVVSFARGEDFTVGSHRSPKSISFAIRAGRYPTVDVEKEEQSFFRVDDATRSHLQVGSGTRSDRVGTVGFSLISRGGSRAEIRKGGAGSHACPSFSLLRVSFPTP